MTGNEILYSLRLILKVLHRGFLVLCGVFHSLCYLEFSVLIRPELSESHFDGNASSFIKQSFNFCTFP